MSSARLLQSSRLRLLRSLRPPNPSRPASTPRLFTQNSQLLFVAPHKPRPQIQYLTESTLPRQRTLGGPSQQLARLLTTENRKYVKEQVYLVTKIATMAGTFLGLSMVIWFGIQLEIAERENPTPEEWRFMTRQALRNVRNEMTKVERGEAVFIQWALAGNEAKACLARLEDTSKEGSGIVEPAEGEGILIPGVGKSGYDISDKSYEWRSGYFEIIMKCATAAEHLDSMVVDVTRRSVFPKAVVIGPSNPDPRPVPAYMQAAPLEENCKPASEPPETYYMRILTGKGFTTKQKLDAGLAYANWLEFKGLNESAEEVYRWSVDIARAALPVASENVIDTDTGVLKADSAEVTPNLLRASTALAIHQARTGKVSAALPILLSVLRARRTAPVSPFFAQDDPQPEKPSTDIGAAVAMVRKIFRPPQFPPPPPSGDNPLVRESDTPTCDESELMLYIGEILFATSTQNTEALGWTRQAVAVADANLKYTQRKKDELMKCRECLVTGVENWETMLRRLASSASATSQREGSRDAGWFEWRGWFGWGGGAKGKTLNELADGVLAVELKEVGQLKARIKRQGIEDEIAKASNSNLTGAWMG